MEHVHPLWFIGFSSVLALFPLFVGLCTSYIKISVVFGMLKSGLGTQQVPSSMLIMLLSLVMTLYIMMPVIQKIEIKVGEISWQDFERQPSADVLQVVKGVFEPFAEFMRFHSGKRELETLQRLAPSLERELSQDSSDEPTALHIALPAFVLTELKEAFAMGFVLLLPFLAIDLIVANILVGLGMFMVSPVMVALPLKLLLFIMADGWLLLTQGLIRSYGAG